MTENQKKKSGIWIFSESIILYIRCDISMEAMSINNCLNFPIRETVQCFRINQLNQMHGTTGTRVMRNDLAGKNTPYLVPTHSLPLSLQSVAFRELFKTKNPENELLSGFLKSW